MTQTQPTEPKRNYLYEHKVQRHRREFRFKHVLVNGPEAAGMFLSAITEEHDREHFYAVYLNVRGKIIGYELVAIGSLSDVSVHPREVFRGAILAGAFAVILGHNHPSGDPSPSPEDILLGKRMQAAGELLGIEVLDSVVVAGDQVISIANHIAADKED